MALRDFFGGVEAREEDAEGNEASAEFPEACSDRSQKNSRCRSSGEAWATCLSGLFGVVENRAGRTELMPNESEACVESGSGHGTK